MFLLIGDFHHEHLAIQAKEGTGHGKGGAPLSGAGLGGHTLQTLLLGVVCLGDGGIQLVGTGSVVAFKLVIDLRRSAQGLFQKLRMDQGRGPVHFVKVQDLLGNFKIGRGVVQLLAHQLVAEHGTQLFKGHGLQCGRIQQGRWFIFHVGAQIVPCFRQFAFIQVDFVRDLCHSVPSFQIMGFQLNQHEKRKTHLS